MDQKSIFNVGCKLFGLYSVVSGSYYVATTLFTSMISGFMSTDASIWLPGAWYLVLGCVLCIVSSWLTRAVYLLDDSKG